MSELKCRTIRESRRQRWMIMMMPCRLVLGLLVLNVVLASPPRYTRQVEPENYDDDLEKVDVEYYDEMTTDEPEIEISPLSPDEDNDPAPEASLEEEEEEPEKESGDKRELPITPSLLPSGSGVPGVSMGPNALGEEELRLTPTGISHISGDSLGSGDLLSSGGSGASGALGISGKIPDGREYHSGEPLGSGVLGSGGTADISSGDISSKDSVDLGSGVSGDHVSGASGDFVSGASGDFVSGASGDLVSGVSEDLVSGVSGDFVSRKSGGLVSEVSGDIVSGVSGESGDLTSSISGDLVSGVSGDLVSGVSGDFVSAVSGDFVSRDLVSEVSGDLVSEVSGDFVSGDSGDFGVSGVSEDFASEVSEDHISGDSKERIPGVSGDSGSAPSGVSIDGITLVPGREEEFYITATTGPEETSGSYEESGELEKPLLPVTVGPTEESGFPKKWVPIIPSLKEEEELFPTTQTPPQEGTGSTTGSGLPESPDPEVEVIEIDVQGMPTCLLCTCLGGSVYCDDMKLVNVPPLPKDTTHFYARFNRITKINKSDFANMNKLKLIDLTSNAISKIEDGALFGLPALEELLIPYNNVAQLPALPAAMIRIDASHNHLGRTGIQNEAFKDMTGLLYLVLTDNNIDHIPVPLPESLRTLHLQNNNIQMMHEDTFCNRNDLNYVRMALEDIRLDGNPVNLSRTPQAYVCLPRIPVGALI